jgi:ribulose-5-phosphate 4-epimerase/fuculose-1-phosphate aldolase
MKEGYVKYRCHWRREPITASRRVLAGLQRWRSRLREAGLVGAHPDGMGFGNLSVRVSGGEFLITGSATGHLESLDISHYALVTGYEFAENSLSCTGLTTASSESLSHAAIYSAKPSAGAVIHVHSAALWENYLRVLPTTDPAIEYGTPEMALALMALARGLEEGLAHALVMGGHRDGLVLFGADLEQAGDHLLAL